VGVWCGRLSVEEVGRKLVLLKLLDGPPKEGTATVPELEQRRRGVDTGAPAFGPGCAIIVCKKQVLAKPCVEVGTHH